MKEFFDERNYWDILLIYYIIVVFLLFIFYSWRDSFSVHNFCQLKYVDADF